MKRISFGEEVTKGSSRTAIEEGMALCHVCKELIPFKHGKKLFCPRCGERIHVRKPDSLIKTWAFVLTATILMFPANFLPIMTVQRFGVYESSTIMDGIIYFFQEGSYAIGIIILVASVLVPVFKIIGIAMVLISIHFRWRTWLRQKTWMFKLIEFVGRWSMLDIFVVSLLQALVNFSTFISIEPAPGITYFAGVVIFTMLAAQSFDLRLLWDTENMEPKPDGRKQV